MTSRLKPRRVTNEDRYPWLLTRFHPRAWHYRHNSNRDKPRRALAFSTLSPRPPPPPPPRPALLMFLPMLMLDIGCAVLASGSHPPGLQPLTAPLPMVTTRKASVRYRLCCRSCVVEKLEGPPKFPSSSPVSDDQPKLLRSPANLPRVSTHKPTAKC